MKTVLAVVIVISLVTSFYFPWIAGRSGYGPMSMLKSGGFISMIICLGSVMTLSIWQGVWSTDFYAFLGIGFLCLGLILIAITPAGAYDLGKDTFEKELKKAETATG